MQRLRVSGHLLAQEFDEPDDPRQGVVEIVRDAPGERAHRLHPLGGLELPFQLGLFRDIMDHRESAGHDPRPVPQRGVEPFAGDLLPVLADIGVQGVTRFVPLDQLRPDLVHVRLRILRDDEFIRVLSRCFGRVPAEDPFRRRVPLHYPELRVPHDVGQRHPVHMEGKALVRIAKRLEALGAQDGDRTLSGKGFEVVDILRGKPVLLLAVDMEDPEHRALRGLQGKGHHGPQTGLDRLVPPGSEPDILEDILRNVALPRPDRGSGRAVPLRGVIPPDIQSGEGFLVDPANHFDAHGVAPARPARSRSSGTPSSRSHRRPNRRFPGHSRR